MKISGGTSLKDLGKKWFAFNKMEMWRKIINLPKPNRVVIAAPLFSADKADNGR